LNDALKKPSPTASDAARRISTCCHNMISANGQAWMLTCKDKGKQ